MVDIAINWEINTINKMYVDWQELLLWTNVNPHPVLFPNITIGSVKSNQPVSITWNTKHTVYLIENPDNHFQYWNTATSNGLDFITSRYNPDEWLTDTLTININEWWYYNVFFLDSEWKRIATSTAVTWENTFTKETYPTAVYFTMIVSYWWSTGSNTNAAKATVENVGLVVNKQ